MCSSDLSWRWAEWAAVKGLSGVKPGGPPWKCWKNWTCTHTARPGLPRVNRAWIGHAGLGCARPNSIFYFIFFSRLYHRN